MSCQQDLEKIQWDKENFLMENEKRWKELQNQKKSGLILDVVRKDKAVAYSFNCWYKSIAMKSYFIFIY